MEQSDYRREIDKIDDQIVDLFAQRMAVAKEIAAYKKAHNLPIRDGGREREKMRAVTERAPEDMKEYTSLLYSLMFDLSRAYQTRLNGNGTALTEKIEQAIENTPHLFPEGETVACQGVEGAYSQIACDKLMRQHHVFLLVRRGVLGH